MATAFNPVMEGKKLVYAARNLRIVPAKEIWPNIENADDVTVLVGEHYVHGEWFPLRSSMVVGVVGKDHETRNSVYRSID